MYWASRSIVAGHGYIKIIQWFSCVSVVYWRSFTYNHLFSWRQQLNPNWCRKSMYCLADNKCISKSCSRLSVTLADKLLGCYNPSIIFLLHFSDWSKYIHVGHVARLYQLLSHIIIHQILFLHAIGLNMSRDAAKTGEYPMIFPKWYSLVFKIKIFCPWTLSVPQSSQFSSSFTLGKLFASWNRLCPRTNIHAYLRTKWRLLFI